MILKKAPMGWNSWDCYGAAVDEATVRKNAEFMAKHLLKYGWEYVVVDIQWSEPNATNHEYNPFTELNMDSYGRLIPAENRFPSSAGGKGFKPLADYIHSLGLKFGIHIMRGIPRQAVHQNVPILGTKVHARDIAKTDSICAWNTDMYGVDPNKEGARDYYDSIFQLYASWDVDFIKCDDIAREFPHAREELIMLSECLHNSGREMVLSLSPGPAPIEQAELFKKISNMWRITDDFWDDWKSLYEMFERTEKWASHNGAGHFADADMLPIGPIRQDYDKNNWTLFTRAEQRSMMTLWSIFRSPLMIGGEMTGFDDFTMDLITNKEILKMHKNARHSHQVFRKMIDGSEIVAWIAASSKGDAYVALFNIGEKTANLCISLEEFEIYEEKYYYPMWNKYVLEDPANCITCRLESHDAEAFRIINVYKA